MKRESTLILTIVFALVLIGIFMVYSASAVDAGSGRLTRQLVYVSIGLVLLFLMAHFDYHQLQNPVLFRALIVFSLALLVLVLVPGVGVVRGGARRWIEIGAFTFQPSELAKFGLILILAVKLSGNQENLKSFRKGFIPPVVTTAIFAALILAEKDLGGPIVLCAVAFLMLLTAGIPWRYLVPSILPVVSVVYTLAMTSPHRVKRLMAFMDPWQYSDDEGYQLIQSMAAFAQGAVWGRGPGAGEQKLYYLPEAHTDFIFAVWAEEMGLIGSLVLLGLFLVLIVVALRVAVCARDLFGTLMATGIISLVAVQAAINMAVTTGLLPTKGLPLPFISWGGSSLIVFMTLMGILINIGLQAVEPTRNGDGVPAH